MDKLINSQKRLAQYKKEIADLLSEHPDLATNKMTIELAYKCNVSHTTVRNYFKGKGTRSDIAYDILNQLRLKVEEKAKAKSEA